MAPTLSTILLGEAGEPSMPQMYFMSLMQLRTFSRCVELLVELRIANSLSSLEPIDVKTLARRLDLNETNLHRVLRYVASQGLLKELDDGRSFVGTELSDLLREDTPGSVADMVRQLSMREMQLALMNLDVSVKTGKPSFAHANGNVPFYEYLSRHPEAERTFDKGVNSINNLMQNKLVYSLYDFSRFATVVELAGGQGGLIEKILRQNVDQKGILLERAAVLPNILPELQSSAALKNRFEAVAGDILDKVDVEGDLFVIANTLMNFNDSDAEKILSNIAEAMKSSQLKKTNEQATDVRLLVIEPELGNEAPNTKEASSLFSLGADVLLMYMLGGKMRSSEAWQALMAKCGLKVTKKITVTPTHSAFECQLIA